jgi:hypothetical protein
VTAERSTLLATWATLWGVPDLADAVTVTFNVAAHRLSGATGTLPGRPARFAWEHRCPVCRTARYARRRTPAWRCAECLDNGLAGELTSRRTDEPAETA